MNPTASRQNPQSPSSAPMRAQREQHIDTARGSRTDASTHSSAACNPASDVGEAANPGWPSIQLRD